MIALLDSGSSCSLVGEPFSSKISSMEILPVSSNLQGINISGERVHDIQDKLIWTFLWMVKLRPGRNLSFTSREVFDTHSILLA